MKVTLVLEVESVKQVPWATTNEDVSRITLANGNSFVVSDSAIVEIEN